MAHLLQKHLISEINHAFEKEDDVCFLSFLLMSKEKDLLDNNFLEFYFIKSVHYGVNKNKNMIVHYKNIFGLDEKNAGQILQKYVSLSLNDNEKMTSVGLLVMDNVIENALISGILFEESFLLRKSIMSNVNPEFHKSLLTMNKSNNINWIKNELDKNLNKKDFITDIVKI